MGELGDIGVRVLVGLNLEAWGWREVLVGFSRLLLGVNLLMS